MPLPGRPHTSPGRAGLDAMAGAGRWRSQAKHRHSTIPTPGAGQLRSGRLPTPSRACSSAGCPRPRTRSGTACTRTPRSPCPGRCRTPACWLRPAIRGWLRRSPQPLSGGTAAMPVTRPPGSRPALTEAELMALLLPTGDFASWLGAFLPGIEHRDPAALFEPALVSDSTDGQIAHLHGLNASRAWCWRRIAESLPPGDDRTEPALAAARIHADAALPHVTGDDYMVEHWLAAYAVLLLT